MLRIGLCLCLFLCCVCLAELVPRPHLDEQQERYLEYLYRFGKDEARSLNPRRLARFVSALEFIERQGQDKSAHYKVGLNEMSDWYEEELSRRFSSSSSPPFPTSEVASRLSSSSSAASTTAPPASPTPTPAGIKSLNWASSDNRLGKSILPPIRNQGVCGACWSFVAVAAVEASVHLNSNLETPLPLSAQELIDCDTAINRGCAGGNPLYAYEYTMVFGLTSWTDYGYKERAGPCQRKKYRAQAGITGFVRLAPNDQTQLLEAVSASPVAVGICGTDQGFIYYESGIYDASDCCVTQNHAILLVGYGHDSRSQLDYWLAYNSWGESWGENGYMRIVRRSGADTAGSNSTGQCGLATSPCAAIGGYLMHPEKLGNASEDQKAEDFANQMVAKRYQLALQLWLENNWRTLMLGASLSLLAVSLFLLWMDYSSAAQSVKRGGDRGEEVREGSYQEVKVEEEEGEG